MKYYPQKYITNNNYIIVNKIYHYNIKNTKNNANDKIANIAVRCDIPDRKNL